MPKYTPSKDLGKYRIIPTGTKKYFIQAQHRWFFDLFSFWSDVGWDREWGFETRLFNSLKEAIEFIDLVTEEEKKRIEHRNEGITYYP